MNKFGSNLQAFVSLLNTTHNAWYVKQNATLNSHVNFLANLTNAHALGQTNKTNAFLAHLETNKEIVSSLGQAIAQAASMFINSTVNLTTSHLQTHISVAQLVIGAALDTKLASDNATSIAHQTILLGVGKLIEQKMLDKQLFYGNISIIIGNITNAMVYDLQTKVNETTSKFEYFNNKTLIACDAMDQIMVALLDKHNSSVLAFTNKTTLFLSTISDIVNTTKFISSSHFANKTGNLLNSVADIFEILSNASTVKQQSFVQKFNTSVIAMTDAMVGISAAAGDYKATKMEDFQLKMVALLQNKSSLHANVTRDLNALFANLTEAIAIKVSNITTKISNLTMTHVLKPGHLAKFAMTRQSSDRVLMEVLGGFWEGTTQQISGVLNATGSAFQQGMNAMQQQVNSVGQSAEAVALQISTQLNSTVQHFVCAQNLIPEYLGVFSSAAMNPIGCSASTLETSLKNVMDQIEKVRLEAQQKMDATVEQFQQCRNSAEENHKCSEKFTESVAALGSETTVGLQKIISNLSQEFQLASCFTPAAHSETFDNLQHKLQTCMQ